VRVNDPRTSTLKFLIGKSRSNTSIMLNKYRMPALIKDFHTCRRKPNTELKRTPLYWNSNIHIQPPQKHPKPLKLRMSKY
jgi:hypothetical protein